MPIHIDRMETEIEIAPAPARRAAEPAPAEPAPGRSRVRELIGEVLAEEIDSFMRRRGLG